MINSPGSQISGAAALKKEREKERKKERRGKRKAENVPFKTREQNTFRRDSKKTETEG